MTASLRMLGVSVALTLALPVAAVGQGSTNADFCQALDEATTASIDQDECTNFIRDSQFVVTGPPQDEALDETSAGLSTAGAWVLLDDQDAMTDERQVAAYIESDSGTNAFGRPSTLFIGCFAGTTGLLVDWGDYLGSDTRIPVDMRVGDGAVTTKRWLVSSDNTGTLLRGDAPAVIKSWLGETKLVLRATPYNEGQTTFVFDITGIDDAIATIREECDW